MADCVLDWIATSVVPAGVVGYFFREWRRMVGERRLQSRLAVQYLKEIRYEVDLGKERLKYLYEHGGEPRRYGSFTPIMPSKNWEGVRGTLPDAVTVRILAVAENEGRENQFGELRIHLKNYFTVVCRYGNAVIRGEEPFEKSVVREDLDGAKKVLGFLEELIPMMERNAARKFWPR